MKKSKKPHVIKQGDLVGVIALSSAVAEDKLNAGIRKLEALGFPSRLVLNPAERFGKPNPLFASDTAMHRAAALMQLVDDPAVKAIICARGGFGSQEILPLIDFQRIAHERKVIVGFSDVTALLAGLWAKTRLTTIHGPCIGVEFAEDDDVTSDASRSVESLIGMISGDQVAPWSYDVLRGGHAEGPIIVGNLTMLVSLLGTPWDLDYDGSILLIEEVNEAPYRVHRMLTQLRLAGKLTRLAGLIFGRMSRCEAHNSVTIESYVQESVGRIFADTTYPIGSELAFGHHGLNSALPFGCLARMEGGILALTEKPLASQ